MLRLFLGQRRKVDVRGHGCIDLRYCSESLAVLYDPYWKGPKPSLDAVFQVAPSAQGEKIHYVRVSRALEGSRAGMNTPG